MAIQTLERAVARGPIPVHLKLLVVAIPLAMWFIWKALLMVRTGEAVLIERLGRYLRTAGPGIHILVPAIDRCRQFRWTRNEENPTTRAIYQAVLDSYRVPTQQSTFDFPPIRVVTKDQIRVSINGILWFRIIDAYRAVYNIENMWTALEQTTLTRLRELASMRHLDDLMQNKRTLQDEVMVDLNQYGAEWGIDIGQFDIQSIEPPDNVMEATQQSINARHSAQARLTAERAKREVVLIKTELASQRQVQQAKAQAEAAILSAEAEYKRQQLEIKAKMEGRMADAEATRSMVSALGGDARVLVEMIGARAVSALAGKASGVQFMPLESLRAVGGLSFWSQINTQQS